MEHLFWGSVAFIGYVYGGYPLLLRVWAAIATRPVRKHLRQLDRRCPLVSVVIAARNEGFRLPRRVRNLHEQRYPSGEMEIIVVSDGSSDDTRAVLDPFPAVRLIETTGGGKAAALNAGVAAARGEIIVFADARQQFAPDAISELVANFNDPDVGCVSGELVLDCELDRSCAEPGVSEAVGLYWRYEKWLRRHESRIWSTVGATGAIYALRRSLWQPLPAATLLDDVLAPMRVVLAGKRSVFEPRACAFDRAARHTAVESRRKVRTLAGNYQILRLEPRLLVPFVNPVWVQYVSHKIARLLVPWALLISMVTSTVLASTAWIYLVALILQLGFYGLAALGAWTNRSGSSAAADADESHDASQDMSSWDSAYTGRSTG